MGRECAIGFADLFRLAKKRGWTAEEARAFQSLTQPERNAAVLELAREAGGIHTEDRLGSDGLVYTAFWLEEAPEGA